MVVSITFCGGCNPKIDRGDIGNKLKEILEGLGLSVVWDSLQADFVVFISGCSTSCACRWKRPDIPSVIVAGTSVNHREVAEEDIIPACVRAVRAYIEHHTSPQAVTPKEKRIGAK
jgi:hypothetical protein